MPTSPPREQKNDGTDVQIPALLEVDFETKGCADVLSAVTNDYFLSDVGANMSQNKQ